MKKRMRMIGALLLTMLLVFALPFAAVPAQAAAKMAIQLDGQTLKVATLPIYQKGKAYVEYKSGAKALNATTAYSKTKKLIKVTKNNSTTTIKDIVVKKSAVYVSAADLAKACGYLSGYDAAKKTVLWFDLHTYMQENTGNFTKLNQALTFMNKANETNLKIEGTFQFDAKAYSEGAALPFTIKGDITGLSSKDAANMKLNLAVDLSKMMNGTEIDASTNLMLNAMKDMKMQMICDLKEGRIYMQSDLIAALANGKSGTWYYMDLGTNLTQDSSINVSSYLETIFTVQPLTSIESVKSMKQAITSITTALSDESFVQKGSNYEASFNNTANGANTTAKIILKTDGTNVNGIDLSFQVADTNTGISIGMGIVMDNAYNTKATFQMMVPNLLDMNGTMTYKYTPTTDQPLNKPNDGAPVIDFNTAIK